MFERKFVQSILLFQNLVLATSLLTVSKKSFSCFPALIVSRKDILFNDNERFFSKCHKQLLPRNICMSTARVQKKEELTFEAAPKEGMPQIEKTSTYCDDGDNKAWRTGLATAGIALSLFFLLPSKESFLVFSRGMPSALAAETTTAKLSPKDLENLNTAFKAYRKNDMVKAKELLDESINAWTKTGQASDEIAALYKLRANAQRFQKNFNAALEDYDTSVSYILREDSNPDPEQVPDTYLERARCKQQMGLLVESEKDYSLALEGFEDLGSREATNAFTWNARGNIRRKLKDFEGAAQDHLEAKDYFELTGDDVRAAIALSDLAIELYGSDQVNDAIEAWGLLVEGVTRPVSRDIPLLKQLAQREAEAHIALAAHYWGKDEKAIAESEWNQGCLRLDAILVDEAFGRNIGDKDMFGIPIDKVESCKKFKDKKWISSERNWPENLATKLKIFLQINPITS